MNYLQILAFVIYIFLVFVTGVGVFAVFDTKDKLTDRRSLFLGEILLLGNILIVGELVTLSLTKLYYGFNLWILISLNLLFLLRPRTRAYLRYFFNKKFVFDPALIIFFFFLLIFTFRNCFPLMDNDSHTGYLWMQKLWLLHKTSIFGDIGTNLIAYLPHLESVPYGLGMVLFGQETLFQGLINLSWRWIVLLLVFGYTSYRFNRYYGLSAALFVLLNDHFFYSGINFSVLLNGAVIAFVFAAVYNFWESREHNSPFRFMLALIFLSQIIATKFQMAIVIIFLSILMIMLQKNLIPQCREIIRRKNWFVPVLCSVYFAAFWFLKNYLITGLPTFPLLAGKFQVMGWTPESDRVYAAVMGGIDFFTFLKYMNYVFIWPGINPAKIVIVVISFLPLLLLFSASRTQLKLKSMFELSFWLGTSILIVMGITLACHQDPRYYRYGIGVLSFASVYSVRFIFHHCLAVRNNVIIAGILILIALVPIRLILVHGTKDHHPSIQENINVLLNKLHTSDLMDKFYPRNQFALKGYYENPDKVSKAAWDVNGTVIKSAFILPERPHVGVWYTALVRWDSYDKEELVVRDLRKHGIEWVMDVRDNPNEMTFKTPEEYAKEIVKFDRYPKQRYFNFGFPPELSATNF